MACWSAAPLSLFDLQHKRLRAQSNGVKHHLQTRSFQFTHMLNDWEMGELVDALIWLYGSKHRSYIREVLHMSPLCRTFTTGQHNWFPCFQLLKPYFTATQDCSKIAGKLQKHAKMNISGSKTQTTLFNNSEHLLKTISLWFVCTILLSPQKN